LDPLFHSILRDVDVVETAPILWSGAEPFYSSSRALPLSSQMQSNTDEIDGLFGWAAVARSRRDGRLNTFAYRSARAGWSPALGDATFPSCGQISFCFDLMVISRTPEAKEAYA